MLRLSKYSTPENVYFHRLGNCLVLFYLSLLCPSVRMRNELYMLERTNKDDDKDVVQVQGEELEGGHFLTAPKLLTGPEIKRLANRKSDNSE